MTIRVISFGDRGHNPQYDATCWWCGCVFTFRRIDATCVEDQRVIGKVHLQVGCPDPDCGKSVWVNATQTPEGAR